MHASCTKTFAYLYPQAEGEGEQNAAQSVKGDGHSAQARNFARAAAVAETAAPVALPVSLATARHLVARNLAVVHLELEAVAWGEGTELRRRPGGHAPCDLAGLGAGGCPAVCLAGTLAGGVERDGDVPLALVAVLPLADIDAGLARGALARRVDARIAAQDKVALAVGADVRAVRAVLAALVRARVRWRLVRRGDERVNGDRELGFGDGGLVRLGRLDGVQLSGLEPR